MGTTADQLQQAATTLGPWFGLALTLLGIAAQVARAQRRSSTVQGKRIGDLEKRADSEQNRRLQVEAVLLEQGIPLPWWPPDCSLREWQSRQPRDDDDDQDDEYDPRTSEAPRIPPPIPPLPERVGTHRRTADR